MIRVETTMHDGFRVDLSVESGDCDVWLDCLRQRPGTRTRLGFKAEDAIQVGQQMHDIGTQALKGEYAVTQMTATEAVP